MTPDAPTLRGTAQNPDVFFQAREAANPSTTPCRHRRRRSSTSSPRGPDAAMGSSTTSAPPTPNGSIVLMGSAAGAADRDRRGDDRSGREGRPPHRPPVPAVPGGSVRSLPCHRRRARSPCSTAPRSRAPSASRCISMCWPRSRSGRSGRPAARRGMPRVIGGRYGLSSKEITPSMVAACSTSWPRTRPKRALHRRHLRRRHAGLSLEPDRSCATPGRAGEVQAMFFGLGSDGTVGANKSSVKIIGEQHRPLRPGLLRLRLEEVGFGHGVAPAVRARTDPLDLPHRRCRLRRLPPVRPAREDEGARVRRARARRSCSTARGDPTRCGTTCRWRCR